jgi:hypothetical protein
MRRYIAPFAGLAFCVIVFTATVAVSQSVIAGLVFGVGSGLAAALIAHSLFPAGGDLDQYRLDARRRVKKLLDTSERVKKLARNVKDTNAKAALMKGCEIIPDLVSSVQSKQSGSVASTAARMQNHMLGIEKALTQYLEIQADPEYFPNAVSLIARGNKGFEDFRAFALESIQQVNVGNIVAYEAGLDALAPMPELTA